MDVDKGEDMRERSYPRAKAPGLQAKAPGLHLRGTEPRGFSPGEAALYVLVVVALGTPLFAQPKPARIVSLIPAVTEMMFAIGAGDQVVGVSTFDTYPKEATTRPKVGGLFDPNFEA